MAHYQYYNNLGPRYNEGKREIAEQMDISYKTVQKYFRRVARDALDLKIGGVRDRHFWISHRIIQLYSVLSQCRAVVGRFSSTPIDSMTFTPSGDQALEIEISAEDNASGAFDTVEGSALGMKEAV
ncbi:hypothetical protein PM023_18140, partial [Halorubrum ezzemoulense]|uniref:hypothetical protein n=1 Tax=Halorubrum ezzemoulense TaxID=337243 RepID=UPI00232FAA83